MPIGEPVPLASVDQLTSQYNASRMLLPIKLQDEMRVQIAALDAQKVFAEIRSYQEKRMQPAFIQMCCGALCLLGRARKQMQDWDGVKGNLNREVCAT